MILLSSPLKIDPLETTVSIFFFLEIEIFTTKIVNSKSLKKTCRQLLSTMNVLKVAGVDSCATNRKMTQPGCTKMAISQLLLSVASSQIL